MVSGTSLFISLFNNLAIFIVLVAVYGVLNRRFDKSPLLLRQFIIGISFGLFAISCMHVKIPVAEGVIVDQRNTVVALSGAFGGPLSAVLCALMTGIYRLYLGGSGALGGVIGIALSALAGAVCYKFRNKIDSILKAAIIALAATIIILPGFLFWVDLQTGWQLLKAMALPYGSAIFIGLFFVGLLLEHQERSHSARIKLKESEKRYRESEERLDLALSGANEGIWDWDIQNKTIDFDSRYYMISGYSPNEFPAAFKEWEKRVHPGDIKRTQTSIEQYLSGDSDRYDAEYRFLRKDGSYMWIKGKGKVVARDEHGNPTRFIGTHSDITDRKNAEEALRIIQFSFDKAAIGIYRIGSDAKILDANERAVQMIGYTKEELSSMRIFDMDPLSDRENWGQIWQSLQNKGQINFESIHRRKDGVDIPVEITSNLLEYEGQQFSIAFVRDITERKGIEAKQRALERQLSNALEIAHLGYWEYDVEADIFTFNKQFYNIFRNTVEQIGGYSMSSAEYAQRFVHPEDRDLVGEEIRKAIETSDPGFSQQLEHRILYADGEVGYINVRYFVVKDKQGKTIRTYGVNQDITERRKSEEIYRITRFSIEQASIGYLMGSKDARILDVNKYVCDYLGYTHKELCSMSVLDINPTFSRERWSVLWQIVKERGVNSMETTHRRKDGTLVPIAVTANHFEFQGNEYVISFYRDIAERKKAEKEKEDLQKQLLMSQKVEAIGRLAGGVAHDLNNMLTPVMGYGELLLQDLSPEDERRNYVKQILNASYNARDLVHKLLAFGRKQTLEYKRVNLNETIIKFEELLRRTIREDIDLEILTSPDIENIKADIGQIEQIIMNLCVNAQDAMPDGGKLIVETAMVVLDADYSDRHSHLSERTGKHAMLAISDTGCGIDESIQQQIFEPFFTTKGELGTGLGLATVYGIVKQHEGDIWVYSEPGKGTTFKVYLPVADEQDAKIKTHPEQVGELTGSETIIIVEDNATVRNMTSKMLHGQGYTVFSASNGTQALEMVDLQKCSVDLLLTDVVMPDMNGKELYSKLSKKCPGLKVLYMSGYTDNVIAHRGVLDEGVHFIQKPFSIQGLSIKVGEALERD